MYKVVPSLPSTPFSQILALDFETYYDSEYTLKKLATSAYIRDTRFKAYGASVRMLRATETAEHVESTEWVRGADLAGFLGNIDWSQTALLAHHAAFDGLILSHHFGHIPAYYLDTMSMARGLHDHSIGAGLDEVAIYYAQQGKKRKKALEDIAGVRELTVEQEVNLAAYAIDDTDEMIGIFEKMIDRFPEAELDLIHITVNMFCNPVLEVDHALVREELVQEIMRREEILESVSELIIEGGYYDLIHEAIQEEKVYKTESGRIRGAEKAREKRAAIPRLEKVQSLLSSDKTFPMLISALGEQVAMKPGKNKDTPATAKNDLEFKRLQATDVPHVAEVCEARLNVKSTIAESRAARLLEHSTPRLPVYLNYCKAHTMRWSGGDKLNPQNFPAARKGNPARLRRSICAPKGYVLVVSDSSQIEDRKNCWFAGQDDILDLYRAKKDVYGYTAETLYNAPKGSITKYTDPARRDQGKVARLGLGFGCGAAKYRLINQIGAFGPAQPHFTEAQAMRDVNTYRRMSDKIVTFWGFLSDMLNLMIQGGEYAWQPPHADRPIITFHPEGVDMPNGLTLWYPDLQATRNKYTGALSNFTYQAGKNGGRAKIYGGLFTENLVQCAARIVVAEQMRKIAERYRIVLMTHDEVVFLAPEREAEKALEFGLNVMSTPPDWAPTLPVAAEGGYAKEYSK